MPMQTATDLLTLYVIQQSGMTIPHVGRTRRTTYIRLREHLKTPRFGGGLEPIGEFSVDIPRMKDPKDTKLLIRMIEQQVIEQFGGKTQLLNARNEMNAKDYKKWREFICGK